MHGQQPTKQLRYRGPLLLHTRHTALRNMMEAGMEKDRAKAISGHITDSTFSRYNIGKEGDVECARQAIEQYHRVAQRAARVNSIVINAL
jgi:hypothetical protein